MLRSITILFLALFGCSPIFMANREAVKSTKTAALVGLLLEVERPNHIVITLGKDNSMKATREREADEPAISEAKVANQIATLIEDRLRREFGFQMKRWETVASDPAYTTAIRERKKTIVFSTMSPYPIDRYRPTQLASEAILDSLSESERNRLIEGLKVETVITAVVKLRLNREDQLSIGRFSAGVYRPSAIISIRMYGAGKPEPIWEDRMAGGSPATRTVNQVSGVTSQESLEISFGEATQKALDKLISRFQTEK